MPRGHTAKTCSGRRAAQSGAVIIGRRMVYAPHPLLPPFAQYCPPEQRSRAAATSRSRMGDGYLYRAGAGCAVFSGAW